MLEQFIEAIKSDDRRMISELLDSDPNLLGAKSPQGLSMITLAMYHGKRDVAQALLEAGAELDIFEAAMLGRGARVTELLDSDPALLNARSADAGFPLAFASFFGNVDVARLLLDRGADVKLVAPSFGSVTPLHSAAAGRSLEIVRMLIASGADVNATQANGYTPLHTAAGNADRDMAEALLSAGANAQAKSDDGKTPADIARERGHLEIADWLSGA